MVSKSRFTTICIRPPLTTKTPRAAPVLGYRDVKARLLSPAESENSEYEKQDHRAHEGDHDFADDGMAADREVDLEDLCQDTTQEGPQNPGDDVTQEAEIVAERDPAGQRPSHQADQDPDNHRVDVEMDCHGRSVKHMVRGGQTALAARSCSAAPSTRLKA